MPFWGGINGDGFDPEDGYEGDASEYVYEPFFSDQYFYHEQFRSKYGEPEIVKETDGAILVKLKTKKKENGFWIPRKLIKMKGNSIYIWKEFKPTYIEVKNIKNEKTPST
jgi:hypothetical protein